MSERAVRGSREQGAGSRERRGEGGAAGARSRAARAVKYVRAYKIMPKRGCDFFDIGAAIVYDLTMSTRAQAVNVKTGIFGSRNVGSPDHDCRAVSGMSK